MGNAFAKAGLAHTGRAIQADDGRFHVATQIEHGNLFQNTFLHLCHAIVIAVENAFGPLQVEVVGGECAPGQPHECLQVVQLHTVLRALRVEGVQFVQFFVECGCNVFGPYLVHGLFLQFFLLQVAVSPRQFLLDVLDLLLQEVFALLLVQVFAGFGSDVLFQFQQLYLTVNDAQHGEHAFLETVLFEKRDFLVIVKRQTGAYEVGQHHGVADILQGKLGLVWYVFVFLHIVDGR